MVDYTSNFRASLEELKKDGDYRIFADIKRCSENHPEASNYFEDKQRKITIWCSNDYLCMGHNKEVMEHMKNVIDECGAGAGGTRNISGNTHYHVLLEKELSKWHNKEQSLVFSSGYVANLTALSALGLGLKDCVIFSDEKNHNSMIAGIKYSRARKEVFKHNDVKHLETLLAKYDKNTPKIIAFESVYSMDGDIAPIEKICDLADKYNALTYLDEVHAVGMYGKNGAGVAQMLKLEDRVDVLQATLGKAVGVFGGYISASSEIIDFVRSFGQGFIFTTSLPPSVVAGCTKSVQIISKDDSYRKKLHENVKIFKEMLRENNIDFIDAKSHIVPIMIKDAKLCKKLTDFLLEKHNIYVQPINYPTVPKNTERIRVTPSPRHTLEHMEKFVVALKEGLAMLNIKKCA